MIPSLYAFGRGRGRFHGSCVLYYKISSLQVGKRVGSGCVCSEPETSSSNYSFTSNLWGPFLFRIAKGQKVTVLFFLTLSVSHFPSVSACLPPNPLLSFYFINEYLLWERTESQACN